MCLWQKTITNLLRFWFPSLTDKTCHSVPSKQCPLSKLKTLAESVIARNSVLLTNTNEKRVYRRRLRPEWWKKDLWNVQPLNLKLREVLSWYRVRGEWRSFNCCCKLKDRFDYSYVVNIWHQPSDFVSSACLLHSSISFFTFSSVWG